MGKITEMRVVIDTNVLISALLFDGTPGRLIALWKQGRIKPQTSKEMIDEYIRVLAHPKFELAEEEIDYLLHCEILPYLDVVTSGSGQVIVKEDPSDDKFIRCAETGKARYIITRDHHLLKLKTHGMIEILTPSRFFEKL